MVFVSATASCDENVLFAKITVQLEKEMMKFPMRVLLLGPQVDERVLFLAFVINIVFSAMSLPSVW